MKTIAVAPVAHVAHPASETGANDGVAPTEDEHGYDLLSIYKNGSLPPTDEGQQGQHTQQPLGEVSRAEDDQAVPSDDSQAGGANDARVDDLAEAVARRVVELLGQRQAVPSWLTADDVAQLLAVERAYVYEHKAALGARQLGDGPRARLRFRLEDVEAALPCVASRGAEEHAIPTPKPKQRHRGTTRLGTGTPAAHSRRTRSVVSDEKRPASGLPARDYTWPPFEPRNTAALRHGAYGSIVTLGDRVEELAPSLAALVPGFQPSDDPATRLLALTFPRIERAVAAIEQAEDRGEIDSVARLTSDLRGWVNASARLLDQLGLTPLSRGKLLARLAGSEASIAQARLRQHLTATYGDEAGDG